MTATINPATAAPESVLTADTSEVSISSLAPYVVIGIVLGVVMVKSEVIFWYRIHEMFRLQSFHMYGVLGTASVTAFASLWILRQLGARSRSGEVVALAPKDMKKGHRYWIGGATFGIGWALCGACPGPLFALIGTGRTVYIVTGLAALAGTWSYGVLRPQLPH